MRVVLTGAVLTLALVFAPLAAAEVDLRAAAQLESGEFAEAARLAEIDILDIEGAGRPFDPVIVDLYRILGDARVELGDYDAAISAFERAREERRMIDGLHGLSQLELLYREADAHFRANNTKEVTELMEYAFEVRRQSGSDEAIVEGMVELGRWYEANRQEAAARQLYREALEIVEAQSAPDDLKRAQLYRAVAQTYRSQFFPSRRALARPRSGVRPRPYGVFWRDLEAATSHPRGADHMIRARQAFETSVEVLEETESQPVDEMIQSLLQLGDWYLLTGYYGRAFNTYERLYGYLQSHAPDRLDSILGQPELLHARYHRRAAYRAFRRTDGATVEIELDVNRMGGARNLRTVRQEPITISAIPVRIAIRKARFRPAFVDGRPAPYQGFRVTHSYE